MLLIDHIPSYLTSGRSGHNEIHNFWYNMCIHNTSLWCPGTQSILSDLVLHDHHNCILHLN